ncbi:MAG TPA: hypothetical protein VMA75_01325 [Candidatus Paceibacterota bacterium]|nr:hypothetical protein [Candidatus Paceibacterota bacterium]
MRIENQAGAPKTNEEYFQEIEALLGEGWKFGGNDFQQDQTWRVVMTKEGEEDKEFHLTKAYPKMVDRTGTTKNG